MDNNTVLVAFTAMGVSFAAGGAIGVLYGWSRAQGVYTESMDNLTDTRYR